MVLINLILSPVKSVNIEADASSFLSRSILRASNEGKLKMLSECGTTEEELRKFSQNKVFIRTCRIEMLLSEKFLIYNIRSF